MNPTVSVIIPTFNEQEALPEVLNHLAQSSSSEMEVIVVDGGSTDGTLDLIKAFDVELLHCHQLGRAAQLHLGGQHARGEFLCFLHADTKTPDDLPSVINHVMRDKKIVLAGFVSVMRGRKSRWLISSLNYIKTYFCPLVYRPYAFAFKGLRLLFGDQVMFCRRADYLNAGGFNPETRIMEEAELCLRMNKLGRIKQVHRLVYSSDRRVAEQGLMKALGIYIYVALGWAFGISTQKLSARYKDIR